MKKKDGEMLVKFENILEMTDCKYFSSNEIKKRRGSKNKETMHVINCLIGLGDVKGCQKYCPLYENK